MARQRHDEAMVRRGRPSRAVSLSAVTVAIAIAGGGAAVQADEPVAPEVTVEVTVEVGLPPVPPTTVAPETVEVTVEVGLPPVPPTSVVTVEVGLPPVPPRPDTGGDGVSEPGGDPVVDVTTSIAGAVAATASAAWRSA